MFHCHCNALKCSSTYTNIQARTLSHKVLYASIHNKHTSNIEYEKRPSFVDSPHTNTKSQRKKEHEEKLLKNEQKRNQEPTAKGKNKQRRNKQPTNHLSIFFLCQKCSKCSQCSDPKQNALPLTLFSSAQPTRTYM